MEEKKPVQIGRQVPPNEVMRQWEYTKKIHAMIDNGAHWNHKPKAFVKTFGCQGNVADSEKLLGMLVEMGFLPANQEEEADLVLCNTCAIRENAETRLYGMVGQLKHDKEKNPDKIIGLCGCMMQQEQVVEKVRQSYRQVDLVFGTHAMHLLPEFLYRVLTEKKRVMDCREEEIPQIAEGLPIQRNKGVQASLQIMYGCNNFCSYCIVPYVRGREVSREPEKVLDEAKAILDAGYREILLLGQNVNSYGKGGGSDFAQLLERINALDGDFRIRFMTSHPKDCTEELIDTIARCKKVCRSIHLPVQSGSNRILSEMNRKYTREQYLALVDMARKKIPGVTFTSDIIVGFPGETREEFLQTVELCETVRFQSLFTFLYSPRIGTRAAKMADPVPKEEKTRWLNELIGVQHRIMSEDNQKYIGKTLTVLAEETKEDNPSMMIGRSDQGILVCFSGKQKAGEFVPVTITTARRSELIGTVLE